MVADVPTNASDRPATTAAIRFMMTPPTDSGVIFIVVDPDPESRV